MPPYQRSYSWGEREALDLLGDLAEATDSDIPHFIGAVVLVNGAESGMVEIVDGQQRLTTLTILLAVLRDLETDKDMSARLHAMIADEDRPMLGEAASWRLTLNYMDGAFFRDTIQRPGATRTLENEPGESDSQQRMVGNAKAMLKELRQLSDERRRALTDTVVNGCALVRVVVNDKDQGFKVFRVLNTRGKEPDAHDIIKTELFQKAKFSVKEANAYAERWAEHEAVLGGGAFDDLLRQIRAIHDRSPKGDLVAGFQKAVLSKIDSRKFLDEMLPSYVAAYRQITTANVDEGPHSKLVSDKLNQLRALEQQSWRAPALKFLVERGLDSPLAPEFFTRLERLGYMIQLIIHDKDQRNKRFNKVSDAISNERTLMAKNGPFAISKDEARKVRERLLGRFATFGQRRAMALRLNAALDGGFTIRPESDATVEHVLPRNVQEDSHWMVTWPDPAKRREQCDTLGNFVLLTNKVNQKADRLDYRAKKEVYFNGGGGADFALTRDLVDQDAWTPEVVRKRTERLAEILDAEWDLPR
ncbi:MAG: DUF262 domain-containing HNH endonuclease family protein [Alphaproteobacteria bacterium]|nr:DUF262 domain-containing HNH endonuclease family protein [Alphaproteobacteria bacterium]MBU2082622.1 DUF262 domain-containing HNH endonuclease family protein [Alphaproteobacteria bacterium]MBU2142281.1 DUF262 domain-containing HNH endonuclease family protein [Alphaproteobacteria bacterium]MBU2196676.1 DUF262 domain-containing HNH endonuclease family protein [Alphaproteobacteria bacterium]